MVIQGPGRILQLLIEFRIPHIAAALLHLLHPSEGDPHIPGALLTPIPPSWGRSPQAGRTQLHRSLPPALRQHQQHRGETSPHSFLGCQHNSHCSPEQPLTLCCPVSPQPPALMGGTKYTAMLTGLKAFVSSSNPQQSSRAQAVCHGTQSTGWDIKGRLG